MVDAHEKLVLASFLSVHMIKGRQTDLPKWLCSKRSGEKAFKNIHAAGRVFMLEFRVARPLDIPRAHMALLFDFAGCCRTKKDGLLDYVAGTLVHVVVEDFKSRQTKLEIRHVSSDDRSRMLELSSVNRVYLLGKLAQRPLNPNDFFQSVSVELEAIYQEMVDSEELLSEGEFSVVKRHEQEEEKRYYGQPEKEHSRQSTPSMSLTNSGNIVWRVSDPHGKDSWYSTKDIKLESRHALKDSTQSIILAYGPTQREEIRKVGVLVHTISTESFSFTGKSTEAAHVEGNVDLLTLSHSEHPSHGPYWDNKLNCMSFCKRVCQHWSDLKWPTEGLCAPIIWPLPSLNAHLKVGYAPIPIQKGPSLENQNNDRPNAPSDLSPSKHLNRPDIADNQSSMVKAKSPAKKPNLFKRVLSSISRRLRHLFRR